MTSGTVSRSVCTAKNRMSQPQCGVRARACVYVCACAERESMTPSFLVIAPPPPPPPHPPPPTLPPPPPPPQPPPPPALPAIVVARGPSPPATLVARSARVGRRRSAAPVGGEGRLNGEKLGHSAVHACTTDPLR